MKTGVAQCPFWVLDNISHEQRWWIEADKSWPVNRHSTLLPSPHLQQQQKINEMIDREDDKWRMETSLLNPSWTPEDNRNFSSNLGLFLKIQYWSRCFTLDCTQTHSENREGRGQRKVGKEERFLITFRGCCQGPAAPKPENYQVKVEGRTLNVQLKIISHFEYSSMFKRIW